MNHKLGIGILATFIIGILLMIFLPFRGGIMSDERMKTSLILLISTLIYYVIIIWKYSSFNTWGKIIIIPIVFFLSILPIFLIINLIIIPILKSINPHNWDAGWMISFSISIGISLAYKTVALICSKQ